MKRTDKLTITVNPDDIESVLDNWVNPSVIRIDYAGAHTNDKLSPIDAFNAFSRIRNIVRIARQNEI